MVKLPVEACDPLRAMEAAVHGGADAVGPTARWKAFVFDLNWKQSQARAGGGYGGTQALPVACYTVAEARLNGLDLPMYAGGGVFSWMRQPS
jgi:dihydropyrimidine dehydrogenase (NAD+) subunit PreA